MPRTYTVQGFKVYYGDGEVLSSIALDWGSFHSQNVQVIIIFYNELSAGGVRYRDILSAKDFYYFDSMKGSPWACGAGADGTENSKDQSFAESWGHVLYGKTIPDDDWNAIYVQALADMDL